MFDPFCCEVTGGASLQMVHNGPNYNVFDRLCCEVAGGALATRRRRRGAPQEEGAAAGSAAGLVPRRAVHSAAAVRGGAGAAPAVHPLRQAGGLQHKLVGHSSMALVLVIAGCARWCCRRTRSTPASTSWWETTIWHLSWWLHYINMFTL